MRLSFSFLQVKFLSLLSLLEGNLDRVMLGLPCLLTWVPSEDLVIEVLFTGSNEKFSEFFLIIRVNYSLFLHRLIARRAQGTSRRVPSLR